MAFAVLLRANAAAPAPDERGYSSPVCPALRPVRFKRSDPTPCRTIPYFRPKADQGGSFAVLADGAAGGGFSGTPSDLLPKEMGDCDYETGDDGKMLTTVLDLNVMSFEALPDGWSVSQLLSRIATAGEEDAAPTSGPRVGAAHTSSRLCGVRSAECG